MFEMLQKKLLKWTSLMRSSKKESDNGKTLTVEADMDLKRKMSDSPELTPEKAAKIIDACALPDFRSNVPRKSLKPNDIIVHLKVILMMVGHVLNYTIVF